MPLLYPDEEIDRNLPFLRFLRQSGLPLPPQPPPTRQALVQAIASAIRLRSEGYVAPPTEPVPSRVAPPTGPGLLDTLRETEGLPDVGRLLAGAGLRGVGAGIRGAGALAQTDLGSRLLAPLGAIQPLVAPIAEPLLTAFEAPFTRKPMPESIESSQQRYAERPLGQQMAVETPLLTPGFTEGAARLAVKVAEKGGRKVGEVATRAAREAAPVARRIAVGEAGMARVPKKPPPLARAPQADVAPASKVPRARRLPAARLAASPQADVAPAGAVVQQFAEAPPGTLFIPEGYQIERVFPKSRTVRLINLATGER